MTMAYEVWHGLMYGVGVFVTCNVGGMVLGAAVQRVSGLMEPRAATDSVKADSGFDFPEKEPVRADAEPVTTPRGGQSFADIQREINGSTGGGTQWEINGSTGGGT